MRFRKIESASQVESGSLANNSAIRRFQSRSQLDKHTPERKDYLKDKPVVPVAE